MLQIPLIREAKHLGFYVIATDGNSQAPGFALADEVWPLDTYDVPGHIEYVQKAQNNTLMRDTSHYVLRGVVTCGADVAPTVAAAATAAGVPGIPLDVAQRTHDKARVRVALRDAGLDRYQPRWDITDGNSSSQFQWAEPVVIKPLKQRASRGIHLVSAWSDAEFSALTDALSYGPETLIEERLIGTEHSAEILFDGSPTCYQDGKTWFNIVDRFFDYRSGTPIELGHMNPTSLHSEDQRAILCLLMGAALALDVTWGPFKADVMLTTDGPKILEVTARLSGGFDSQGTSPLTGRHPLRALLQLACGLPIDAPLTWEPAQGFAACAAILPDKTGVVREIRSVELNPLMLPGAVRKVIWTIQPGDRIAPPDHNAERCGFILAHADTYDIAWQRAKAAADALAAAVEVA